MKRRRVDLSRQEVMDTLDALYTAASTLKGRKEMKQFLRDLLTESERIMLGRRILIARMLIAGHTWNQVMTKLRVGPDTIQRVERWLEDQMPGYEQAVERMQKEFEKRKRPESFTFAALKRKYPLHFLLFPGGD